METPTEPERDEALGEGVPEERYRDFLDLMKKQQYTEARKKVNKKGNGILGLGSINYARIHWENTLTIGSPHVPDPGEVKKLERMYDGEVNILTNYGEVCREVDQLIGSGSEKYYGFARALIKQSKLLGKGNTLEYVGKNGIGVTNGGARLPLQMFKYFIETPIEIVDKEASA